MAKVKVYNLEGKEAGELELAKEIFEVEGKEELVHQVVVAQNNNSRQNLAHTKIRSEVRGGGAKPWKQKGTGRARHGSRRSPIWIGGGITFGPRKDRNFSQKVNKKMKNKALCMVLTDKVKSGKIIVLDKLELAEAKTKKLAELLNKLPSKNNSTLISLAKKDEKIVKAANKLNKVGVLSADSLNVVDLLGKNYLVVDKAAIEKIVEVYKK